MGSVEAKARVQEIVSSFVRVWSFGAWLLSDTRWVVRIGVEQVPYSELEIVV